MDNGQGSSEIRLVVTLLLDCGVSSITVSSGTSIYSLAGFVFFRFDLGSWIVGG